MLLLHNAFYACFRFLNITHVHVKNFRRLGVGILVIALAVCMNSCSNASQNTEQPETELSKASASKNLIELSFSYQDIEALKAKFDFDEKSGWYHHKHWGNKLLKRATLTADVNQTGYFLLCSNYYAAKGINHSSVEVEIGDEALVSATIEKDSKQHSVQKTAKGVFELNRYTNYADKGIFQKIGTSENAEVNLRFIGKDAYIKSSLSKADQKALQDCFQLSLILRQLGNK